VRTIRKVIPLDSVIKEAMKFLRASLPAGIRIETHFAPDAPAVLADPTKIYHIAINLATNAHHAMEGHSGTLQVSLDSFRPDESFIRSRPDFRPIHYARLVFADSGHGMDAKTMARIFEPFYNTKPVGKGTGLGLAVVHGIVQSHEGLITNDSRLGEGATFSLYFPARTDEAALVEGSTAEAISGHGERILLLDDEPSLTSMFQQMLSRLNYQVTVSGDARSAVDSFRRQPGRFDLGDYGSYHAGHERLGSGPADSRLIPGSADHSRQWIYVQYQPQKYRGSRDLRIAPETGFIPGPRRRS
jgi:hypothetical protein